VVYTPGDRPHFPLKTARLDPHPLQQKDMPDVFRLYSDWNVARNLSKITFPFTAEAARQFVDEAHDALTAQPAYAYTLAVARRDDRCFIGIQSLTILAYHPRLDEPARKQWVGTGILGYSVMPIHWGQGFAAEGAYRMIAFAFDELRLARLQASTLQGNPASRRILERLGFTIEETNLPERPRYGGPPRLVDRYVLVRFDRPRC
jgi:RimJ/RimL family protein N-acetyltransferase